MSHEALQSTGCFCEPVHGDRRRFPRFRVRDGVLATARHVLGPVRNVSLGGMSFEFFQEGDTPAANGKVGIIDPAQDFWLNSLPCRTVSEQLVNSNFFVQSAIRKRRSIAFLDLSPSQIQQLRALLDSSCVEAVESFLPTAPQTT